jgi:hypothetical protein
MNGEQEPKKERSPSASAGRRRKMGFESGSLMVPTSGSRGCSSIVTTVAFHLRLNHPLPAGFLFLPVSSHSPSLFSCQSCRFIIHDCVKTPSTHDTEGSKRLQNKPALSILLLLSDATGERNADNLETRDLVREIPSNRFPEDPPRFYFQLLPLAFSWRTPLILRHLGTRRISESPFFPPHHLH